MISIKYYDFYRNSKSTISIRIEMVRYAFKHGIKPAARKFGTTVKTVKKWVRRFNENKKKGLQDMSRKPENSPNRMIPFWRFKIKDVCETASKNRKRLTAKIIKRRNNIPYSVNTIRKEMELNGYQKHKRKKYQRKRDLREMKQKYKAFEKIQIDVKYLDDISEMYHEYVAHKLPKYQFTARCIRTGAAFICYALEKTVTNASIFMVLLEKHLKKYNVDLKGCKIQTDNGTEFTTPWNCIAVSSFTLAVENIAQAEHRLIPPGAKTWQSDVETFHRLVEDELYASTCFDSKDNFYIEAFEYQKYFNLKRFNTYKNGSPKQILSQIAPEIDSDILILKPCLLDAQMKLFKEELAYIAA